MHTHKLKGLIVLLGLLFAITSCTTLHFALGMSEKDFTTQNPKSILVEQTANYSVYKRFLYSGTQIYGVKFFYFNNGVLTRVDEGVRQPDVLIQDGRH